VVRAAFAFDLALGVALAVANAFAFAFAFASRACRRRSWLGLLSFLFAMLEEARGIALGWGAVDCW
jgi:hypothetical protein